MNDLRRQAMSTVRRHFAFAIGFSALVNVLYLAPTLYMLQIYDRVLPTGGQLTLIFVTLAVLLALATLAALDALRSRLLVRAGLALERRLAGEILSRQMAAARQGSRDTSEAMRRFDVIRQTLASPAALSIFDAPWTPVYLLFCFVLHPALGILTLVGGIGLLALALLNERATKTNLLRAQELSLTGYHLQETAAAQGEVIRALGMRRALVARQLSQREGALTIQAQAQFTGVTYSGAIKFLRLFLQSLALGLGAWLAVERQISIGAVIAASVLLSRALQPIEQLVGSWAALTQARGAYASILALLGEESPDRARTQLPAPRGTLTVEGAAVRRPGGKGLILKSVSLDISPGEVLGVIGPSGSGKSTLARVVAGALMADAGAVRLDGAEYRDWEGECLAPHIGYLPQDATLLAGSVRDNISRFEAWRGVESADVDAATVEAARRAGVHEMILKLPDGYDTEIEWRGGGLSAGQTQRIALARALYRDPKLLILDEPNASLDVDGEAALMRAISAGKAASCSVMLIAHRSGVLAIADRLLVLRDGMVELCGPADQVAAKLSGRAPPVRPQPVPQADLGAA